MKIITSVEDMARTCREVRRSGRVLGLVPTMGFLHEGHCSLIRLARSKADVIVVSIFVNPIQFGPGEDYERYPRDMERDGNLCAKEYVDILFCPEAGEMYDGNHSVYVDESVISRNMCGSSRPGHFRGVLTVVAKLFNIVQPDLAVFGQKDAQQCRVVRQMVRNLNFPVDIITGPTVREPDGLAMSSRNVYLSAEERKSAVCVSQALGLAVHLRETGILDAGVIKDRMTQLISRQSLARIDYIEIVDQDDWQPVKTVKSSSVVALAVRIGKVRLIDNVMLGGDAALPGSSPQP